MIIIWSHPSDPAKAGQARTLSRFWRDDFFIIICGADRWTRPSTIKVRGKNRQPGAERGIRTHNLWFTKPLLYH